MDFFELSHGLYRQLRAAWFVLVSAGVISIFTDHDWTRSGFTSILNFPPISPITALLSLGVAAPGVFIWYKKSKLILTTEDYDERLKLQQEIWGLHQFVGTICAVGSGVMLLGGLILIQVPIAGWVILASLHTGTIFFIRAKRLNSRMTEDKNLVETGRVLREQAEDLKTSKRRDTKSVLKVSAWIIAGLAVPVIFLTATLTPAFNADFNSKASLSSELVKEIRESAIAGFEISPIRGSSYGIDYVNPDSSFTMTRKTTTANFPGDCKKLIAWGKSLGATGFMFDPINKLIPFEGHEAQAQIACSYAFSLAEMKPGQAESFGSTMFIIRGTYSSGGKSAPLDIQTNLASNPTEAKPYALFVGVTTGLNFGEGEITADGADEQTWDQSYVKYQSVLNALGAYRKAHSTNSFFTVATFAVATKDIKGLTLKPQVSSDGKVRLYYAKNADSNSMMMPMCVSAAPWDAAFAGVNDPGNGYVFGFRQENSNLEKFGIAFPGECPVSN